MSWIEDLDMSGQEIYLIVNDDASIVLEVEESTVFPPERLPLTDDDSRHH